jgi:hypothetical protein
MEVSKKNLAPMSLTWFKTTTKICSKLLLLVRRATIPTYFLLVRRVDRLFALQLRALEDTMPLLVALKAKSLPLVSLTLMRGQRASDGVEQSAIVWRRSATASTTACTCHDLAQTQILIGLDEVV